MDTAAMAAQKLGDIDISSDEGVNEKAADEAAAGTSAGGCDFDLVLIYYQCFKIDVIHSSVLNFHISNSSIF